MPKPVFNLSDEEMETIEKTIKEVRDRPIRERIEAFNQIMGGIVDKAIVVPPGSSLTTEQEIGAVYNVKRKDGEDDQAFFRRTVKASQKGTDAQWAKLSESVQLWLNNAAMAMNEKKDIAAFPEGETQ